MKRVLVLVLALLAAPSPALAQQSPDPNGGALQFQGRPIEHVQFKGNRKVEDDAIRIQLLSKAGTLLDAAKLREDLRAMWKLGFLADIDVEGEIGSNGALTLTFAVVVSTVVSLTITPMICAHYIKGVTSDNATWFDRAVEGSLSRMVAFYSSTLRVVLDFPLMTLLVFFAIIALTVTLYIKTPKG